MIGSPQLHMYMLCLTCKFSKPRSVSTLMHALRVAPCTHNAHVSDGSAPGTRSQWWVGYILGANANYLSKGPGFLDPRYAGMRLAAQKVHRVLGLNPRQQAVHHVAAAASLHGALAPCREGCSKICRAQAVPAVMSPCSLWEWCFFGVMPITAVVSHKVASHSCYTSHFSSCAKQCLTVQLAHRRRDARHVPGLRNQLHAAAVTAV